MKLLETNHTEKGVRKGGHPPNHVHYTTKEATMCWTIVAWSLMMTVVWWMMNMIRNSIVYTLKLLEDNSPKTFWGSFLIWKCALKHGLEFWKHFSLDVRCLWALKALKRCMWSTTTQIHNDRKTMMNWVLNHSSFLDHFIQICKIMCYLKIYIFWNIYIFCVFEILFPVSKTWGVMFPRCPHFRNSYHFPHFVQLRC